MSFVGDAAANCAQNGYAVTAAVAHPGRLSGADRAGNSRWGGGVRNRGRRNSCDHQPDPGDCRVPPENYLAVVDQRWSPNDTGP